jgi:RNA recognition motif-containing protein
MEPYGKIKRIKLESKSKRGFVCFETRQAAEDAIKALHGGTMQVEGQRIKVLWAKGQL